MPGPAAARDALSDRYQAIRAPAAIQADRIARQRLQSQLNALERAEARTRLELRNTERLRLIDPVSSLPAAERALRGELNRLRIEQRDAVADLVRLNRETDALAPRPQVSVGPADPDIPPSAAVAPGSVIVDSEEAVAAARAFVEELLRANRARP